MSSYLVNINGILFLLTYLQVLFVYGGSVSSTGISFVYGDQFRLRGISFVYGGSVSSTGDQFRLRGISFVYGESVVFERLPGRQEKRAGPAQPSGAMRPGRPPGAGSVSRRRRPNARDGGGSADVCDYLLSYYGGSVASTGDQFANS